MTKTPKPFQSQLLTDLSPYIYGTTRLGDNQIPFKDRVAMAHAAMDADIWFHTSDQYGDALTVLGQAFDEDRANVPKLIMKIGNDSVGEIRQSILNQLKPLGVDTLELGQLCLGEKLAAEFANGGSCYDDFMKLKEEGLVNRFVLEVFPWTSDVPMKALQGGYPNGVIDGYIFYLNPLQRFAANPLWDLLNEQGQPIVAMRTVSGGPVHRLRDVPGAAWLPYLQERAVEVAPIFEKSGIADWTEFCIRFAHSFPLVRATVGATSRLENLKSFLSAAQHIQPLPQSIVDEIVKLHYKWSDAVDIHAEPWTM